MFSSTKTAAAQKHSGQRRVGVAPADYTTCLSEDVFTATGNLHVTS